jgi:hypothetical protein
MNNFDFPLQMFVKIWNNICRIADKLHRKPGCVFVVPPSTGARECRKFPSPISHPFALRGLPPHLLPALLKVVALFGQNNVVFWCPGQCVSLLAISTYPLYEIVGDKGDARVRPFICRCLSRLLQPRQTPWMFKRGSIGRG